MVWMERILDDHVTLRVGAGCSQPFQGGPTREAHVGAARRAEVKESWLEGLYTADPSSMSRALSSRMIPRSVGAADDYPRNVV